MSNSTLTNLIFCRKLVPISRNRKVMKTVSSFTSFYPQVFCLFPLFSSKILSKSSRIRRKMTPITRIRSSLGSSYTYPLFLLSGAFRFLSLSYEIPCSSKSAVLPPSFNRVLSRVYRNSAPITRISISQRNSCNYKSSLKSNPISCEFR